MPTPSKLYLLPNLSKFVTVIVCWMCVSYLMSACENSTAIQRDPDPLLQTDQLEYQLTKNENLFEAKISYTFSNTTPDTVFVTNCNGEFHLILEKQVHNDWMTMWALILLECLSPPIIIPSGKTFRDTLTVSGALPNGSSHPQFTTADLAGIYRIQWKSGLTSCDSLGNTFRPTLPLSSRISNRFVLRK